MDTVFQTITQDTAVLWFGVHFLFKLPLAAKLLAEFLCSVGKRVLFFSVSSRSHCCSRITFSDKVDKYKANVGGKDKNEGLPWEVTFFL